MIVLPINEIYESIQGEATFAGTPSVVIRLQGCSVGCEWCDAKHTWDIDFLRSVPIRMMTGKTQKLHTFSFMTIEEIIQAVSGFKAQHVVITGGDPCKHNIYVLTEAILCAGLSCQVETSGSYPIKVHEGTFVTVSPKLDTPSGEDCLDESLDIADEIKYPVETQSDIDKLLERIIPKLDEDAIIWLQPLNQSKSATSLCIRAATEHDLLVSIQTHKLIGAR